VGAFWGNRDCADINQELLAQIGVHHPLDLAWEALPESLTVNELRREAAKLVAGKLSEHGGVWGTADAATCRLLDFWISVFAEVGAEVNFVIAVRNPASIAKSLAARYGLAVEKAYFLWLQHVLPTITHTHAARRIVMDYDELLTNPQPQLARLASFVGRVSAEGGFKTDFLEPGRRHALSTVAEAADDPRAPILVGRSYEWLRLLASDAPYDHAALLGDLQDLNQNLRILQPAFSYIGALEGDREHLREAGSLNKADIAARDHSVSTRDGQVLRLRRDLQRKEEHLAHGTRLIEKLEGRNEALTEDVATRDLEILRFRKLLEGKDRDIAAVLGSSSWRLTKPVRLVSGWIKGSPVAMDTGLAGGHRSEMTELPRGFDPARYLELNPDVATSRADPVEHYLKHGSLEGRPFRQGDPADRTATVRKEVENPELPSGFEPAVYLELNPDVAATGEDPTEHYLAYGHREERLYSKDALHRKQEEEDKNRAQLPIGFEEAVYLKLNPDVAATGADPVKHYLKFGRPESRPFSLTQVDPLAPKKGPREGDRDQLPPGFEDRVYLKLNPDVAGGGLDAAAHYLEYGCHEKRSYQFPYLDITGDHNFRPNRSTILVVSHEASRTGAPVLSLNLVQELVMRYNVVALLLGGGTLDEAFRQSGAAVVTSAEMKGNAGLADLVIENLHKRFPFKFALVNSIESRVVLPALANLFIPTVSMLHEFAAYTRPRGAFREAFLWSGQTVFSTNVTLENAVAHYPDLDGQTAHVLPQGRCRVPLEGTDEDVEKEGERLRRLIRPRGETSRALVVLGAGTVQLRKAVDLFIECAARVVSAPGGENCRFVWIGKGFDAEGDLAYSVYLADQIARAGLGGRVIFIDETTAIESAYEESDLFLLSSRLDPLPNVAIDAMAFAMPVLCFDKTTGIADFLNDAGLGRHCVARYLDTSEMAEKILAFARSEVLRAQVGERVREASAKFFSMKEYVLQLEELALQANKRTRQEEEDVRALLDSGLFRKDFVTPPYLRHQSTEESARRFVRGWACGIGRRKPFPGFHPGIYKQTHGVSTEGADPTVDYIRAGRPEGPWNNQVIVGDADQNLDLPRKGSVAVHLHVHYPELLPAITRRLAQNRHSPDLLVSVTSELTKTRVARHLERYKGTVAAIELVPNQGRDIGPFLTAFGPLIQSKYEYIGHIHTKKTADLKDRSVGEVWFEFLLGNLLGGPSGPMADRILAALHRDKSLGMVFPDDPNVVGWDSNRPIAGVVAARLGIQELPEQLNFPVGTMFWARTAGLKPLMDLNLQWDDYPVEPVPYDGTFLHAVERLLPLMLVPLKLRYATTNVVGLTR